ncbi:PDZ domain-containing protein, partial [Alcaligenes nematophilus]|uniref:M61 family metallopeptidase n=1 Tax=Alcaligenes nematophilus TaxID=2994643 RepID=UPI003D1D8CFD
NRAGHKIQSAALASFDTWIKQYRPDENSPNTSISYYNKGAMLAVALDLKIISDTDGKLRLDDVLKAAYQLFYKEKERGFEEHEFKQLAEEITQIDLSEIFDAAHTTNELDYNSYFNRVGYSFINTSKDSNERSLGLKTHIVDGRILIKTTERNSAAWDAGLNVNDEIIAINNNRLDTAGKDLDFILETSEIDEILDILIARDGLIRTVHTPVRKSSKETWVIRKNTDASPRQKELGEIWLSE